MSATKSETWTYPKGSGIRIRCVTNQTFIDGERKEFGESFQVVVPAKLTGKGRLRKQFDQRKEAEDWAAEQLAGTKSLGEQFFELSPMERREAVSSFDLLRPLGLSLLNIATVYAQAHARLGGRPLMEAVEYFAKRNPVGMPVKTVSEVQDEMIAIKRKDGASAVYLKDLEVRIGKFAESFQCQIAELTAAGVNDWLRNLKCGARARNNYRRAIKTVVAFAEDNDFLTRDHIDFKKVKEAREDENVIEVFTPEEMAKLLKAARLDPDDLPPGFNKRYAGAGLLPLLLLGGFAGLRTAEVQRQLWEDINLERGFIRVTAGKGGTAQKRLVPVHENLKAWLTPLRQDKGLVLDIARPADAIARLAERAGVAWKHNALRHSFISYRVADSQNVAATSLEAGNSPQMIHRHYREVVSPAEAKAWFGIQPSTPANVTPLPAAVA